MSEAYLHMPAGHISQPRRGYIIPHTATPYIILYLAPGRQIVYNMDNKGRGAADASVYHRHVRHREIRLDWGRDAAAPAAAGKTVYYLVPEQYSFEMERRYYADDILVYSMERLADAIFRRCGGLAGAYASDTVQLMLMRETLRDVGNGLSLLQKSAGKPGFAAGMLSLRAELMRAGVDAGALEEAARSLRPAAGEGDALPLKLRDLALIFEGYGAALSRSFLDPSARLARAVEKAAENGFFDRAYVFVDEYKSFTGVQLQMLAVIIRQTGSVSVALGDDPSRQGDALFEGVRETARKLKGIAAKENVPVAPPIQLTEPHRFAAPEIGWFGLQLFKPAPEPFPGPAPGIQCAKLENEYEECFFAAAWIQSARPGKGLPV